MSYLIVSLVLILLIFFHELGHLLAAKFVKIPISCFSIGFGPKLWSRKMSGIEYRFSLIPFGGYVKPEVENEIKFLKYSFYQRSLFVLGGPIANILIALLCWIVIKISYVYFPESTSMVLPGGITGVIGLLREADTIIGDNLFNIIPFTYVISLNLAILNLLPIPPLDGGKLLLYILEKLNKNNVKFYAPMNMLGAIFILFVIIFTTVNDMSSIIA